MERTSAAAESSQELVRLINEVTIPIRKPFGMFGQIQIAVADVTPEELVVRVWTRRSVRAEELARNVRNAFLNYLHDAVPCPWFRFRLIHPDDRVSYLERVLRDIRLPYVKELRYPSLLRSSVILIEENVAPERGRFRPLLREAWERLLEAWASPGHGDDAQQIRGS